MTSEDDHNSLEEEVKELAPWLPRRRVPNAPSGYFAELEEKVITRINNRSANPAPRPERRRIRQAVAATLMLLLVTGVVQTFFAPKPSAVKPVTIQSLTTAEIQLWLEKENNLSEVDFQGYLEVLRED